MFLTSLGHKMSPLPNKSLVKDYHYKQDYNIFYHICTYFF